MFDFEPFCSLVYLRIIARISHIACVYFTIRSGSLLVCLLPSSSCALSPLLLFVSVSLVCLLSLILFGNLLSSQQLSVSE